MIGIQKPLHLSLPFLPCSGITNASVFLNLVTADHLPTGFWGKAGACHLGDSATPRERKSVEYIAEHTSYAHGIHSLCCALERRKSVIKTSLKGTQKSLMLSFPQRDYTETTWDCFQVSCLSISQNLLSFILKVFCTPVIIQEDPLAHSFTGLQNTAHPDLIPSQAALHTGLVPHIATMDSHTPLQVSQAVRKYKREPACSPWCTPHKHEDSFCKDYCQEGEQKGDSGISVDFFRALVLPNLQSLRIP